MGDYLAIIFLFGFLLLIFAPIAALVIYQLLPYGNEIKVFFIVRKQLKVKTATLHDFLTENIHFYSLLNEKEKKTFRTRVLYILHRKNFEARSEATVDEKVQLLFAATLVKLTFGLFNYNLSWHGNIIFFPDLFEFRQSGVPMKGLTYSREKIVFSLPHFLEGIKDPFDKFNVALHEMAHALKVSEIDPYYLKKLEKPEYIAVYKKGGRFLEKFCVWHNHAISVFLNLEDRNNFFRSYAFTNMDEFWAVCVECFFEAPNEFEKTHTELYYALANVLNQDVADRWRSVHYPFQT